MKTLTDLQQKHWTFICDYYEEHGLVPPYAVLQDEFGYSSSNSVYQHLNGLVKKKYLMKPESGGYDIHPRKRSSLKGYHPGTPIKGRISAGSLHEAIEEDLGCLPIKIKPDSARHYFALKVEGNSMINADIRSGDFIILDDHPPTDEDIAAIHYRGETTLKRVYKKKNKIELHPENEAYEVIEIKPDEWEEVGFYGTYVGKAWKHNGEWSLTFKA